MASLEMLKREIIEDLREHSIKLPNIPEVMLRIREALMDDGQSFQKMGRVVQLDQSLASRLIHIANSQVYRGSNSVSTSQAAISRIGLVAVRNIASSLVLKNAYHGKHPTLRRMLNRVWAEGCRVSAISYVLARVTPGLKADKAMLAGTVHNIGALPFVHYLEGHPELLSDEAQLTQTLQAVQGKLGTLLLRQWKFEEDLCIIPQAVSSLQYESGGSKPNYADIVLVAKVHARFLAQGCDRAPEILARMPAFSKMPIRHLGDSGCLELIEKSKQEIDELMAILKE